MNKREQAAADVRQVARALFAERFYDGDALKQAFRSELPLKLMYALREAGTQRWQLEALVLALRDLGEAAPLEMEAKIDPAQQAALDAITAEEDLPAVFKPLLVEVAPQLLLQKDLVAFYAVMNNVIGKWDATASLLHKNASAV
jgi:hypothetical protein